VNRAPRGSRPCGFDPRAHFVLLAGGTRAKGPPLCGVVITARRAGALLTGLATALAVGSRRSGVAITAPKAGAILAPLRFGRPFAGMQWTDPLLHYETDAISMVRCVTCANVDGSKRFNVSATRGMNWLGRRSRSFPTVESIEHERQLIVRFGIGKS
jgi:hypothetical protein